MKFLVLLLMFLKSVVYCLQGCNQTIEAIQGGSKLGNNLYYFKNKCMNYVLKKKYKCYGENLLDH